MLGIFERLVNLRYSASYKKEHRGERPGTRRSLCSLRVIAEAELPVVLRPRLPRPAVTLRYVPGWGAGGSPAAQGIARRMCLISRARPVVMIRVLTSRIVPRSRARVFIIAGRCRLPPPGCRRGGPRPGRGSADAPGCGGGAAEGPAQAAGCAARAGVAGAGAGGGGCLRAPQPAGDCAGRRGLGPGGAGRARLPDQPGDRAAGAAVGVDAGPARRSPGSR